MRIVVLVIASLLATTVAGCLDRAGLDTIGDAGTAGGSGAAGRGAGGKGATAGTKGAGGAALGGHGGGLLATGGRVGTGGGTGGKGAGTGGFGTLGTGGTTASSGGHVGATGGSPGTGGVTGAGGGPVACPAVACNLACPFGNEVDSTGCPQCKCKPTVCPAVACPVMCPNGSYADASGCDTCKCEPPATCVESDCVTPQPPNGPSVVCEDGSVTGWHCQPTPMGVCSWQLVSCPSRCNTISDYDKCVADPTCTWLAPGCAEPALVTGGCYARANIGCTSDVACGEGHQCLKREINPCFNAPCLACAETLTICQ